MSKDIRLELLAGSSRVFEVKPPLLLGFSCKLVLAQQLVAVFCYLYMRRDIFCHNITVNLLPRSQ